jgi:very-short-patch-repair endonuclease
MRRLTNKEFVKRIKKIHGDKYTYEHTKYVTTRKKVIITCPAHGKVEMRPNILLRGGICRKCSNKKRSNSIDEFIRKSKLVHGDKYNYDKVNYVNGTTNVIITCYEHGDFEIKPRAHITGDRCKKCTIGVRSYNTKEFIRRAEKIHGKLYSYKDTVFKNRETPVIIECDKHGNFEQKAGIHLSGSGCPTCASSKGEIKLEQILNKHKIKYKKEYHLDDKSKQYKFDFYLQELNILIEYDGIQHFKPVKFFGGIEKLMEQKRRDEFKNELAFLHNYKLIRIPYSKYSNLENYLLFKISKFYKYRKNGVFYKNFLDICRKENLSYKTSIQDVLKFKTYKGD